MFVGVAKSIYHNMRTLPNEVREVISPSIAFTILVQGNKRYKNSINLINNPSPPVLINTYQYNPCVIILCYGKYVVSPEIVFDQRIGDLLVLHSDDDIFISQEILNCMEYYCDKSGYKLIVVLTSLRSTEETSNESDVSANAVRTIEFVLEQKPFLKKMVDAGKIGMVAGIHQPKDGHVDFIKIAITE